MNNNPANSLEFWLQIKSEFEQSTEETYICHGSDTFGLEWGDWLPTNPKFKKKCYLLATEFLKETDNVFYNAPDYSQDAGGILFSCGVALMEKIYKSVEFKTFLDKANERDKYNRQVRLDFINWCINKFQ